MVKLKGLNAVPFVLAAALLLMTGIAGAAKINIDVNCTMKPGGSEEAAIKKFKEIVEERSEGRMKVRIFMGGQLGKEKAVLELMKIGQTQMSLTGGVFIIMFAQAYDPITIPFYMQDWDVVEAYLEGPMGKKIGQFAEEKGGIMVFGPQKRAPRHMTSNRKIEGPADIKGLKIRLPSMPIWVDVWKELGAEPFVIPAPDIYIAMKTGQVEAHENSLASPYSRKLWEVQKYIILTDHIFYPWHWIGSKIWFESLSPDDQELIEKAVDEARAFGSINEDEMNAFYAEELKKNGMIFIEPDVKAIREAAMPAIQKAVSELAPEVAAEVKRLSEK